MNQKHSLQHKLLSINSMHIKENGTTLKSSIFLWILLSLITCFFFLYLGIKSFTYFILLSVNSSFCIWNMVDTNGKPYSIKMFINIFIYFFFILANIIQFVNNSLNLSFFIIFSVQDYIQFQFILLIILILFNGIYFLTPESKITNTFTKYTFSVKKMIFLAASVSLLILAYHSFNPYILFARGLADEIIRENGIIRDNESSSLISVLLLENFIRPIPWSCFIISLIFRTKTKTKLLLFLFTLVTVCPTGIPRNAAAMYWLPIIILLGRKWIKGLRFLYLMCGGVFIVFPLLDNFRHFNGNIKMNFGLNYLDSMNFDASQIFMAVMNKSLITMGHQLLGVVLFFVPRSIWPDKPIGSGHFLVTENGGWFTNVSMPFFAEGFVNFGYFGIILFVLIIGICAKKLDSQYWASYNIPMLRHGLYFLFLGAVIFIMRGDLLSSFAFTFGICVSYMLTSNIIKS